MSYLDNLAYIYITGIMPDIDDIGILMYIRSHSYVYSDKHMFMNMSNLIWVDENMIQEVKNHPMVKRHDKLYRRSVKVSFLKLWIDKKMGKANCQTGIPLNYPDRMDYQDIPRLMTDGSILIGSGIIPNYILDVDDNV